MNKVILIIAAITSATAYSAESCQLAAMKFGNMIAESAVEWTPEKRHQFSQCVQETLLEDFRLTSCECNSAEDLHRCWTKASTTFRITAEQYGFILGYKCGAYVRLSTSKSKSSNKGKSK